MTGREPGLDRSQCSPERRELRWQDTDIIMLDTRRDYHHGPSREVPVSAEQLRQTEAVLLFLLQQHAGVISRSDAHWLSQAVKLIQDYDSYLERPSSYSATIEEDMEAAVGSNGWHQVDLDGHAPQVREAVEACQRPYSLMMSQSHRATGELFAGLSADWETGPRAVLSFDHHSDVGPVSSPEQPILKSNVMSELLQRNLVDAVAVIGVSDHFKDDRAITLAPENKIDVVSGFDLYRTIHHPETELTSKQPSRDLFDRHMRNIFEKWRDAHIKQMYVTVDLDGLRLDNMGYAGTDYNPLDMIRSPMIAAMVEEYSKAIQDPAMAKDSTKAQWTASHLANFLSGPDTDNYYGVPASWVTRAMVMARNEFGMLLGVEKRQGKQRQRLVGDVVEFAPTDFKNRTGRIAKALAGSMIAEAQK